MLTMPTPSSADVGEEEEELFEAVKGGRKDKVRALMECGCRVDVTDEKGRTVFHWASQHGQLAILCLLLSTTPDKLPPSSLLTDQCPCKVRQETEKLSEGEKTSTNLETCSLTEKGRDVVAKVPNSAETVSEDCVQRKPLATQTAIPDCICRTVSSHVINQRDGKGQTPLHIACNYKHTDLASFLVTLPYCDLNSADNEGNTPLHRAIHNGLEVVACLLCDAGADVRAANRQQRTALHEAIRVGNVNMVRALLDKGCDVNAVTKGMVATTPFLIAIFYYKISTRSSECGRCTDDLLRLLIEARCRLSQGDAQWTPLSASISIENSFIASLLLFNGCRVETTTTNNDNHDSANRNHAKSLLVEAFVRCEPHVVRLLVLCGYHPTVDEVDQCCRRMPSFSPVFYRISGADRLVLRTKTQLLQWLRKRATCACSLLELCRVAVRMALNYATGDVSIVGRMKVLPLPTDLIRYLSLSDFTNSGSLW